MTKFEVVLSASYTIDADDVSNAIFKAICELADEIHEHGLSVTTIRRLFGANAEEIIKVNKGGEK